MDEAERRRQRIERLARKIWESEGRPDGQALRHWAMAERLIEAEERALAAGRGASADRDGDPPL